jgi:hypothetical protein
MEKIVAEVINSDLYHSKNVASEANTLHVEYNSKSIKIEELLPIYLGRAKHLEKFNSKHANDLLKSTNEFCSNMKLTSKSICNFYRFKGSEHHMYLVVAVPDSLELLGCLRTVDKRNVSTEEWDYLWSNSL